VQSWLLIGLAFLMVSIMWLTGGKKLQTPTKSTSLAASTPPPLEVNETKIVEMQNRIQDLQRSNFLRRARLRSKRARSLARLRKTPNHPR